MRTLAVILVLLFGLISHARADSVTLTNIQALELASALNSLDGYDKVIKEAETERVVKIAYNLSSAVRLAVSHDMVQIHATQVAYQDAMQKLRAQYMSDGGLKTTADGKSLEGPKLDRYTEQVRQMLDAKVELQLQRLKISELKLDENPIPASVLASLQPILEDK